MDYYIAVNDTPEPDENRPPKKVADVVIHIPENINEYSEKATLELRIDGVSLYRAPFSMWAYQTMMWSPLQEYPRADSVEYLPTGEIIWRRRIPHPNL